MESNLYKTTGHPFARPTRMVDKICEPIFKLLDVQIFTHTIMFPDNNYTGVISSNHPISHYLFNTGCYKYIDLACNFNDLNSCTIVSSIEGLHWNMPEPLKEDFINYLLSNDNKYQIYIAVKNQSIFESFWLTISNKSTFDKFMNNYSELYYFILHYKESINKNKLLTTIYPQPMFNPKHKNPVDDFKCIQKVHKHNNNFMQLTDCKHFYFPGFLPEEYLTRQQIKCIKHIMLDRNTTKATADLLHISPRTVERHMYSVRKKFHGRMADLLHQVRQIQGLL